MFFGSIGILASFLRELGHLHEHRNTPQWSLALCVVKGTNRQHNEEIRHAASHKRSSSTNFAHHKPAANDYCNRKAETTDGSVKCTNRRQPCNDEEIDRLSQECGPSTISSCVKEDDSNCSPEIFPLTAFEICASFKFVMRFLLANGHRQVCESGGDSTIILVDYVQYLISLVKTAVCDEVDRRSIRQLVMRRLLLTFNTRSLLGSERECKDKDTTDRLLNCENVPESLLFDVWDEYSNNTKSKALHEHSEENQG
jgi:hypothetical protein